MVGILYMVATPIGNLEDITLRALRVLKEVDLILAEDTRVTRRLLSHYDIDTPTLSYHQHSSYEKKNEILSRLLSGQNIALVTDAGTPGISDPGNELIDFVLKNEILRLSSFAQNDKKGSEIASLQDSRNDDSIKIIPIPGASAIISTLSVSGLNVNKFVFLGFLPKKKRNKLFNWLKEGPSANSGRTFTFAFYESPNRILKTLEVLKEHFGEDTNVFIARELTKLYESLYRGKIEEVKEELQKGKVKGEIVVVVDL